jgi:uncharacterized lipoprotein
MTCTTSSITKLILTTLFFVAAWGCAHGPQFVRINPEINAISRANSVDVLVELSVLDTRADKKIGTTGNDKARFDITLKDNIATVLSPKLAAALESQGMSVISRPDVNAKKLTISIDRLTLDSLKSEGFGYLTAVNAEVVASIETNTTRFSKRYTVSTEKEMSSATSTQTTQEMLNAALSKALSDVVADEALIGVLTQ